jgi:probable HAF family extracellular repeat protein
MRMPSPSRASRLAALLLLAGAAVSASAATYRLVDLGLQKFPVALNDHDDIAAQGRRGVLALRDGRWHLLADGIARAEGINAHGDIVGQNGVLPVLWQSGEEGVVLGLPPGNAGFGSASGINNARTVVGSFESSDDSVRCVRWTFGGEPVDLGFMGAGGFCEAFGVNNAGQVTGDATATPGAFAERHAFVLDRGTFRDLGTLPQGGSSTGIAIDDRGDVAGQASVPPLDFLHFHAVFWPAGGEIVDLDPQDRFLTSTATGINNRGEVVGTVTLFHAARQQKAVRFDGQEAVRLESEVSNLGGWTLDQATGVNNEGEILGVGHAPDGRAHGFLLRPQ